MTKPPIARQHCRHYSFVTPFTLPGSGPNCAAGVNLEGATVSGCMPGGTGCPKREDWTDEERAAWEAWAVASRGRTEAAIAALPSLGPLNSRVVRCPNCEGFLTYTRTARRAYVSCATPDCVRFETALRDASPWPASK